MADDVNAAPLDSGAGAERMRARFPRVAAYHPDWITSSTSGGANALCLAEWLSAALTLKSGMRVLDLGCGRAATSIFLAREWGVQVWAVDLWFTATENWQRICDAKVGDRVFPLHADARSLPFAGGFFDAIVCIDALNYFGTDALYLNYLAHFVRVGGQIAAAGAALEREFTAGVPEHLQKFWGQDCWGLHSAAWWRQHWERTGIVSIETADQMPDGWLLWLDWHRSMHPDGSLEIETLQADRGDYLGYSRVVGRRNAQVQLEEYCWPDTLRAMVPYEYEHQPLLRDNMS